MPSRIVRCRERLGGFASAQQLEEIDGLPESTINYIKIDEQQIRKMNINKLTLNQLKKHPYLNFYQAKEICDYRRLKGPLHRRRPQTAEGFSTRRNRYCTRVLAHFGLGQREAGGGGGGAGQAATAGHVGPPVDSSADTCHW